MAELADKEGQIMRMTEQEWLSCRDPMMMLDDLCDTAAHRNGRSVGVYSSRHVSGRKLHLWAAAVLNMNPIDIMSVRGVHNTDGRFVIRLSDAGSNGDCDNYTVQDTSRAADLLREIFGNPHKPYRNQGSRRGEGFWVPEWSRGTPYMIALEAYRHDVVKCDIVLVLADALEDAGCRDDDILNHLRSNHQHVKGCWTIDLIIGES